MQVAANVNESHPSAGADIAEVSHSPIPFSFSGRKVFFCDAVAGVFLHRGMACIE